MTIDEIFAALPEEVAQDVNEYLVIDPASRTIKVPESESIFGVEADTGSERKYFICPRYVGDKLDLAAAFLSIIYRNANGEKDEYLVEDVATNGDYVTFSWAISEKVVKYKGVVQFRFYADTGTGKAWGTTNAQGESLEGMTPEIDTVEEQTSDVVTQLRAMVTKQTGNVETAGAAQVAAVDAQGTTTTQAAVEAIQAQGAATLATIPAEYTELETTVDRLTRDRAAAIVCQAEGAAIQVQDTSNDPLQGLRIFGKSTQDGTPTPEAPVEIVSTPAPVVGVYGKNMVDFAEVLEDGHTASINGITAMQKGGIVTVSGKNTATTWTNIVHLNNVWPSNKYRFPAGTYSVHKKLSVCIRDIVLDTPRNISGTFTAENPFYIAGFYIAYAAGETANDEIPLVFAIGPETPTAYEPYKEGQALVITTPGSLPGIPVASGGNYTDANGQQWIADEVDLTRGVYVQRVGAAVFTGSDGKEILISTTLAQSPATNVRFDFFDPNVKNIKIQSANARQDILCNYTTPAEKANYSGAWLNETQVFYGRISIPGDVASTVEELKTLLQVTPIVFAFPLATPIETPLTDVELQAFLALHSNKPTTTVLNDAGAHMVLEYAADPKTYIDNKLAALVAANN